MSKYEVFQTNLTIIQNAIKTSVCDVADKCSQRGIVPESVRQSVVHGVKTPEEKVRELLIAVGDQIKTDELIDQTESGSRFDKFDKFVKILEEEAVHENLVRSLKKKWVGSSTQSWSDVDVTAPLCKLLRMLIYIAGLVCK